MRRPVRVAFILHVMQVAGAEVLVAETIRRLGARIEPTVLCLDGVGQLGERVRREGVTVVDLGRKPGLDLRVARRLSREVSMRGVEIIHAHQYTPFFYSALARPFISHKVHIMLTEHGRHYPDHVSARRRVLNRLVLSRMADEINGVCRFSVDSLARVDGFGNRPMEVIDNGIDVERYGRDNRPELRRRLGLDESRRYITCVARLHPVKNHAMLIRAFARVAGCRPDVDLLLAGDGELRADITTQVGSLGLATRVHFLGVRQDVADLLGASDIFALTSISEAASLTLLEAMATALPVVVTAVGGNPEIVEEGHSGFMVARDDDAAAATALLTLLDDPDHARAMGEAGRRITIQRFQLDKTIETYYSRYAAAADRLRESEPVHA
jgi:glycosyltransferase involved in cell wall biosynthesis